MGDRQEQLWAGSGGTLIQSLLFWQRSGLTDCTWNLTKPQRDPLPEQLIPTQLKPPGWESGGLHKKCHPCQPAAQIP